jgi:hypothetical protein
MQQHAFTETLQIHGGLLGTKIKTPASWKGTLRLLLSGDVGG